MAGRDPAFAGGRPDEPPAGTPATPAIVIVLVAAIRGECRCVAANPFRLLPSRRLRVHPELLSFAVLHACRRDARGRREPTNKPSPTLQAGIANSGTFRHYHGEKGCGRVDQVHLS